MFKNIGHRESSEYIGRHIVADFWHCDYEDNADKLLEFLINAAHISHSRIIKTACHQFDPTGSTAILLLAESHMSIHTWPEYNYIAIDIFTCGHEMKPEKALAYLEKSFKPKKSKIKLIKRGKR